MAHRHKEQSSTTRAYTGTALGAHYLPRGENRAAHGGVCHVQRCACGARREVNTNGRHTEYGAWVDVEVQP
jgi:hypothetical protein